MNRGERRRLEKLSRKSVARGGPAEQLGRALQCLRQGQLAEAESIYRRILVQHPREPNALHFLGLIAHRTGRYDEAVQLLQRGKKAAPAYAELRGNLGVVLLEQGRVDDAVRELRELTELSPDSPVAWANLGNALHQGARLDDAAASYDRALALNPAHVEARYRSAAVHLERGDLPAALGQAEACLRLKPDCQHALAYRALAAQGLGDRETAGRLLDLQRFVMPVRFAGGAELNDLLERDIRAHSSLAWQPADKVTRGGSVARDLLTDMTEALTSFEQRLRQAIHGIRGSLEPVAGHPFLGRIPQRYRLTIIASILPSGGYHPAHIHEGAWLSGVYYVRIPGDIVADAHGGWIAFGPPNFTVGGFEPEVRMVRPEEGLALFFPSYLYHGTVPFEGAGERISIAFDVYAS